jgi:serine protease Do
MPMDYRREAHRTEILVRLMGVQRKVLNEPAPPQQNPIPIPGQEPGPGPGPGKKPGPGGPPRMIGPGQPEGPAAKLYVPKAGFANYYFNKLETDRLMKAFKKHGDFADVGGNWVLDGTIRFKKLLAQSPARISIAEEKEDKSMRPVVVLNIENFTSTLRPMDDKLAPEQMKLPETSGGLLSAMHLYRLFLTVGDKGFSEFTHGGHEPFYPPPLPNDDGKLVDATLASRRVDTEVIVSRSGAYLAKWFFSLTDQKLLGMEVRLLENEDPCEVYFYDYRPVDGRMLPHKMQVAYGNGIYGTFTFNAFKMAASVK